MPDQSADQDPSARRPPARRHPHTHQKGATRLPATATTTGPTPPGRARPTPARTRPPTRTDRSRPTGRRPVRHRTSPLLRGSSESTCRVLVVPANAGLPGAGPSHRGGRPPAPDHSATPAVAERPSPGPDDGSVRPGGQMRPRTAWSGASPCLRVSRSAR